MAESQELWDMFDRVSAAIRTSHSQLSETIKSEVGDVKTQLESTRVELTQGIEANRVRIDSLEKEVREREDICRNDLTGRVGAMGKEILSLQHQVEQHEKSIQFYKRVAYGSVVFAATSLVTLFAVLIDNIL